mgnify:CR=1 FL=1
MPDGAEERLETTVAALRRPETYPGEVFGVEAIETHMSWVFLTESHAYKLKKPVRTRYLDSSTRAARRRACETEIELNRRLAESVYLKVAALAETPAGLKVDGEGRAVDWLVKMRRLPREQMLDRRIEEGVVRPEEIERLSEKLTGFYQSVEAAPFDGPDYRRRIAEDIEAKRASLLRPRYGIRRDDLRAVATGLGRWLVEWGDTLEGRGGRVVEAHGDLRPEHVCLELEPVVIDCLAFDRQLRLLDPVSELCFLALECRRLGASSVGQKVLRHYADAGGDAFSRRLIPFYESYHALVRAAVAVWHIDDETLDDADSRRRQGNAYLRLARHLLETPTLE